MFTKMGYLLKFKTRRIALVTKIIVLQFFLGCTVSAQSKFEIVSGTSQNTNNYILNSTQSEVYLSSTEGLNIFHGLGSKVYRPSTHQMYGYNIQSPFFEDSTGKVWFTT